MNRIAWYMKLLLLKMEWLFSLRFIIRAGRPRLTGQPVDIARADYILRVMNVPAGQHTIEMWFDPQSLHVTESIAYASLALLLIGVMILIWFSKKKLTTPKKKEAENS